MNIDFKSSAIGAATKKSDYALKSGIDFSLTLKVLDGFFFQYKALVYIENLLFSMCVC